MQAKRTLAIITGKQNSYRVDLSMLKIGCVDLYSRGYQLDATGPQTSQSGKFNLWLEVIELGDKYSCYTVLTFSTSKS